MRFLKFFSKKKGSLKKSLYFKYVLDFQISKTTIESQQKRFNFYTTTIVGDPRLSRDPGVEKH